MEDSNIEHINAKDSSRNNKKNEDSTNFQKMN